MNQTGRRWPSSRKLALGYAVALALLLLNVFLTLWNLDGIRRGWSALNLTHEVIVSLDTLLADLRDAETGQRGYLLTGEDPYLEPYRQARATVSVSLARVRRLTANNGVRQIHARGIEQTIAAKLAELEHTIELRKRQGLEPALAIVKTGEGRALMDRLRKQVADMEADEVQHRSANRARLERGIRHTVLAFLLASTLSLSLLFVVYHFDQRSREELRISAHWLTTTLRSIGDAVITTDAQGRVDFLNPVAETLTGWTPQVARNRPLDEVFRITNEETGAKVESPVARVLREGMIVGLANHTVLTARDGSSRPIEDSAAPILDDETIKGVVLVFRDASQARESEAVRERLYQELRETDKRKDEFLAMLAHELRNPLAAIGNAVSLTAATGLQEHIDWSMRVINRQIKHLSRLIDDLLDVSRISRGKIELRRAVVDLTPILDSVLETVRPLVDERKHSLSAAIDRGHLWVNGDPTRLEQVVVNLLSNAAKYTDNGGRIDLSARSENDEVVITVRDNGVGIPTEKLPEMFVLFAQGDRSLARSEGGLGIGLTVVKKLVEMHGGTVTATSGGAGQGSEFTVRLPAVSPPAGVAPLLKGPHQAAGRTRSRILVVDDNVDTARGLARLLTLLGHDVHVAHDGPQAIEAARTLQPDVFLLDIGLPKMSGYEVATRLRREECCTTALFIAISGYGQDEDRRRSRESGFDHHLVKPIDHDALLTLLTQSTPS